MKKGVLAYLTPILALGLSGIAAVISVLGMSKLFAGQALIVMIVMGFIEAGKVIGVSILHSKWKIKSYKTVKWPLLLMVIIAMAITSLGIYGFFTDAYQKTANQLTVNESEIGLIENKKENFYRSIENKEEQIEIKNKQAEKLIDLRTQQEIRLDSLYNKNFYNSARETEKIIKEANLDLRRVQSDVDSMYMEITSLNDSIAKLDIEILNLRNNNEASAELGPLIYIAKVFKKDMDYVINFVMLFIMIVFDPLAIVLVIITNKMWERREIKGGIKTFKPIKPLPSKLTTEGITPDNKSEPLVEGKTKGNIKKSTPRSRQAPPPPPVKNKIDKWEPIEEDTLDDIKSSPIKPKKVEPKQEKTKIGEPNENIVVEKTKGEEINRDLQKILKKKKIRKNTNGIQRLND